MVDTAKLVESFESCGIYIDILGINENEDIDIRDFITSSIQFISLIVAIEEKFNIEFPDEYLVIDTFSSLKTFIEILDSLIYK